jgi:multisubunit Na+/H+ antiporter MnhB subunit
MSNWIAYGILFTGLIFCLFLIYYLPRRSNRVKNQNIQEYEEARNKLTFRKKVEEVEEPETSSGGGFIAPIIGAFVTILIGVSLIPAVTEQVNQASTDVAFTSTWGAMVLKTVPAFFALAILCIGIAVTYNALKNSGLV